MAVPHDKASRQARVSSLFDEPVVVSTHKLDRSYFMRLPRRIQTKILGHCPLMTDGVVLVGTPTIDGWCPNWFLGQDHQKSYDDRLQRQTTLALLLTCRRLSREATSMLYSTNRFQMVFDADHGRNFLISLRSSTIAQLHYLHAYFYIYPPRQGICMPEDMNTAIQRKNREQRTNVGKYAMAATTDRDILRWEQAILHMSSNVVPGSLEVRIVCETEDPRRAQAILRPLDALPRLLQCYILLSQRPDQKMKQLSRLTAQKVMRTAPPVLKKRSSTSRLITLPKEVRLMILSYTNLVHRDKEVYWSPDREFHSFLKSYESEYNEYSDPYYNSGAHRLCLSLEGGADCFCQVKHGAYAPKCQCWSPPTSLFLVNKVFSQDALEVFYGSNRFIVMPEIHPRFTERPVQPQLPITHFLCDFVPERALRHIRDLEIVFPPVDMKSPPYLLSVFGGWLRAIDLMATRFKLSAVSLHIIMARAFMWPSDHGHLNLGSYCRRASVILDIYLDLIDPLSKLPPLRRFGVDLEYPYTEEHALSFNIVTSSFDNQPRQARKTRFLNERLRRLIQPGRPHDPDDAIQRKASLWAVMEKRLDPGDDLHELFCAAGSSEDIMGAESRWEQAGRDDFDSDFDFSLDTPPNGGHRPYPDLVRIGRFFGIRDQKVPRWFLEVTNTVPQAGAST